MYRFIAANLSVRCACVASTIFLLLIVSSVVDSTTTSADENTRGETPNSRNSSGDASQEGQRSSFPQHLMLVSSPVVQEDIKLDDEQRAEVARLGRSYMLSAREHHRRMLEMMALRDSDRGSDQETVKNLGVQQTELAGQVDQQTLQLLRPVQFRRLAQLRLRAMGAEILLDPTLRTKLGIHGTQWKQLSDAFLERDISCKEYLVEARKQAIPHQDIKTEIDELRTDAWSDMQQNFTPTQKQLLREVLGPEPDFKPSELQLRLSLKAR